MHGWQADARGRDGQAPEPLHAVLVAMAEEYLPRVLPLLEAADVRVLIAATGEEAVRTVYRERPGLLLVGTHLPGLSPWEVVRLVREMTEIPITVLDPVYTAAHAQRAFALGAGNYIAWPLPPEVVAGRLRHLLGEHGLAPTPPPATMPLDGLPRSAAAAQENAAQMTAAQMTAPQVNAAQVNAARVIDDGWVRVDPARHEAFADGWPLELTVLEFDLLALLTRHPGQVLTYEQLLESAWGLSGRGPADSGRVKAAIGRLRRKLTAAAPRSTASITGVRGLGYRYLPPVSTPASDPTSTATHTPKPSSAPHA